jgi:predicted HAD superfamily Cof-like phosphohydrolase
MNYYQMVQEFHEAFSVPRHDTPTILDYKTEALRISLIAEEWEELDDALVDRDIVGIADALADLVYVLIGMADVMGIDFDAVFSEVHASNMSKLGVDGKPVFRDDGKVLKGPNYFSPDIEGSLGFYDE